MDASQFLIELWGERPPGQVLVWRLPGKKSVWYFDLTKVRIDGFAASDIYTGVGLAAPGIDLKATERVLAENVIAIPALWAEVDIKGPAHQKQNLPVTYEAAYALLDQMPLMPTIVVNSGHGLQAWWLFNEPWIFADEAERKLAAEIAKWWNGKLKELAAPLDIDAVHDLARVMRLPETTNHKGDPVPVRVERQDGPRYTVDEIRERFASEVTIEIPEDVHTWQGEHIELGKAEFPFNLWEALMDNEPKFKRSWNRTRTDLTDQSQSSYDMSLATLASTAGWGSLDIAAMLRTHREKYGSSDDPKLQRADYYERTIEKAREPLQQDQAQARLEQVLEGNAEDRRDMLLKILATMFGVEEIRVKRFLGDPHTYRIESSAGDVTLGGIDNITNQRKFRNHVADATGVWVRGVKKEVWERRIVALLAACEDVDTGEASHRNDQLHEWAVSYLDGRTVHPESKDAFAAGEPFLKDGYTHIRLDSLKTWLIFSKGERLSTPELGRRLHLYGATTDVVSGVVGDRRTTRLYWVLPNLE